MIKSNSQTNHIGILNPTGYDGDDNLDRAHECGVEDCMSKRSKLSDIKIRVDRFIERRASV